ncbi:cupin domain-containing protein [Marinomonas balearica]|uniref:50S ribosomal protein L16 3-hydroxylase n=1 Tax=Marinomonas balearica TaxID=491947 RepID=A0A4R6MH42_9GAMM|nr:cupin domain-containing protein [Marinomonas balearica]TDO99479.1 50S ribosomal protein L16 3-hydroxylase [Marinomonas balearica]
MTSDTPISILGGMTLETFLSEYWQKKPLLIRGGLTDIELPLDANELAGLSMEEEAEARIVIENGKTPWQLMQGPFQEDTFQNLPEKEWTLLVQAVDHWVPEVQALKERFYFLPSWRLDDVMISYATEGGSVGPHYDQYDVFLIQMSGKRHWQVAPPNSYEDSALENTPLHILDGFPEQTEMEWDVAPGDILYLPPNFAHNGRSLDNECLTYSIGFRAPSSSEALSGINTLLEEQASENTALEKRRFCAQEPLERPHHGEICQSDIEHLRSKLIELIEQPELLTDWLGETMSESKYPEFNPALNQTEEDDTFDLAMQGASFIRPGDARICYYQDKESTTVYCNGVKMVIGSHLTSFVQAVSDDTEFDFSGLDLSQSKELEPLLRFFFKYQALVALPTE